MPGRIESWEKNFINRVMDMCTLGNVVSTQNRFILGNYIGQVNMLRNRMVLPPPAVISARGTPDGAVVRWKDDWPVADRPPVKGFNVYRDGQKLNGSPLPATAGEFADHATGVHRYAVAAVGNSQEGPPSVGVTCETGSSDCTAPRLVVISPPVSAIEGRPVGIKARVLDGRDYPYISATLYYRALGEEGWRNTAHGPPRQGRLRRAACRPRR